MTKIDKAHKAIVKALDLLLVFGGGALLDPHVAEFVGKHQGVATGCAIGVAVLRAADKALGGKAATTAA